MSRSNLIETYISALPPDRGCDRADELQAEAEQAVTEGGRQDRRHAAEWRSEAAQRAIQTLPPAASRDGPAGAAVFRFSRAARGDDLAASRGDGARMI